MRTALIAGVMQIMLFCVSPMANADIVELSLDCNGVYDFDSPYWTTDFNFGITFTEISHVYIDWSGEITAGLAVRDSNPTEPFPLNVGITAYLEKASNWTYTSIWDGASTYPAPELFDLRSPFEPGMMPWSALLDGQGTIIIQYEEVIMIDGHYVEHGSVTLDSAILVVVGTVAPEFVVGAEVDIEPDTLNLQSKGKWFTCHIWLPEDYNVADIKPSSVLLENEPNAIKAEWLWFDEQEQVAMAKFIRSDVQDALKPGEVTLTVSGRLTDGNRFEGTDTIRVIDKGGPIRVNSNSKIEDGIEYYVQTDKSVYDLGEDVELLYIVTNFRDEEWRFSYVPPIMDIIIEARERGNFNEIWHWSWDKTYPAGPIVFRLEPGESTEISGIWPQINLHGSVDPEDHTQVPPGRCRISGVFPPTDNSIAVDITIVKRKS